MPDIIEARYEGGVFKPLKKVGLKEGEKVMVLRELNVHDFVFGKMDERRIKELENLFENEDVY
ncbi:MAG: antitoxin family protein [Euryarchaeota archaeon]|nr:antitoxin family protein [Euryarchaeota archaeon]